jgi:hypothetical protein
MAGQTGLSQSSVSRIWRPFGLKPHLVETWKLSADPEFIAKVRDVVGLYMSPPEHEQQGWPFTWFPSSRLLREPRAALRKARGRPDTCVACALE